MHDRTRLHHANVLVLVVVSILVFVNKINSAAMRDIFLHEVDFGLFLILSV